MLKDSYNNFIDTKKVETIEYINQFNKNFLSYNKEIRNIINAADNDKFCLIINSHAAIYGMFMDSHEGIKLCKKYLSIGEKLINNKIGTEREVIYFNIIKNLFNEDIFESIKLIKEIVKKWPEDLFSTKLAQLLFFSVGDNKNMKEIAEFSINYHLNNPYAWGLLAFALEESNNLSEAKNAGLKAIKLCEDEPWAHHAVAHVYETLEQPESGIKWMNNFTSKWEKCNSFMYTHNWWHICLFYIKLNEIDKALAIFDKNLWSSPFGNNDFSQDQAGAISILIRLKLLGINTGSRWEKIISRILKRQTYFSDPFVATHFAYAISSSNNHNHIKDFKEKLKLKVKNENLSIRIWEKAGTPLCKGMIEHAAGNYSNAVKYLKISKNYWHLVGGSHAQRHVFKLILINSLENCN